MTRIFFLLLTLSGIIFFSCKKENDHPSPFQTLQGNWEWQESNGGFAGWQLTPASEGYTQSLEIDTDTYKMYRNDSLLFESTYTIKQVQDPIIGPSKDVIELDTQSDMGYQISNDSLFLFDQCFDCYFHLYTRK
ncbi:MAG: hypothetical protein R2879_21295 [Saprospiraceae bacterium]